MADMNPSSNPSSKSSIPTITSGIGRREPLRRRRPRMRSSASITNRPAISSTNCWRTCDSGHRVTATVFIECRAMYRADGPEELRPGRRDRIRQRRRGDERIGRLRRHAVCAGIVGHVDLLLGERAAEVMEAHLARAPDRFRGIRQRASWDADPACWAAQLPPAGPVGGRRVPRGICASVPLGLSFEAWVLEPQLPEVRRWRRPFPIRPSCWTTSARRWGSRAMPGRREERFDIWRRNIRALAAARTSASSSAASACLSAVSTFPSAAPPRTNWRRCGGPISRPASRPSAPSAACSRAISRSTATGAAIRVLWNAFKRLAAGASAAEKAALFHGAARRFYRLQDSGALADVLRLSGLCAAWAPVLSDCTIFGIVLGAATLWPLILVGEVTFFTTSPLLCPPLEIPLDLVAVMQFLRHRSSPRFRGKPVGRSSVPSAEHVASPGRRKCSRENASSSATASPARDRGRRPARRRRAAAFG